MADELEFAATVIVSELEAAGADDEAADEDEPWLSLPGPLRKQDQLACD